MSSEARARFASDVRARLDADPRRSAAEIARQAHTSRTHLHRIARGDRWPSRAVAAALDDAFDAGGALSALWRIGNTRADGFAALPHTDDLDTSERVEFAARCPRRVDTATVTAVADALAATRRLEDSVGAAAVLPTVGSQLALAERLAAGARAGVRREIVAVAGEIHQYAGWLYSATGDTVRARRHLRTALAAGMEIDDPDLTSVALSFLGHVAWDMNEAESVITLSRAAGRDSRVFVGQRAYNAFQEARGHGMTGDADAVGRAVERASELAEQAVAEQHDGPAGLYWYGRGFFTIQRGTAWHSLRNPRYADHAADTIAAGVADLPAAEAGSEWAATFAVREAWSRVDAGSVDRACDAAARAGRAAITYGSPSLGQAVRDLHTAIRTRFPRTRDADDLADVVGELPS